MSRLDVFVAGIAIAYVLFILEMVRRRQLKEKYALLWVGVGAVMVLMAIARPAVDAVFKALGVSYRPAALFVLAILFLMLVVAHLSWEVSRLEGRSRKLAEEIALLRAREPKGDEQIG